MSEPESVVAGQKSQVSEGTLDAHESLAQRRARFQRVDQLFRSASALPSEQRQAFVAQQATGETSVDAQVMSMLRLDERAGVGRLDRPVLGEGMSVSSFPMDALRSADAAMPEFIARYRIIRVLGEGGMGIVYEAEQENPRRRVALKVLRPGTSFGGRQRLQRFQQEAQILGRLQHPGIAQILEAGATDVGDGAQPFFVMEYVHGKPLLEHARDRELSVRARLELMVSICDTVHFAHQGGVVHRDLKPGNVLVVDEASPSRGIAMPRLSGAQPKILDFGVARLTDADIQTVTVHTTVGELIGTIPYMSPEQAAGDPSNLDWRSDVYSLGVILYELLTGRLPQDLRNLLVHEAVRVIREDDPTPAGSVDRTLRGDVETILAKALEKDKSRRYQSAADLASDIRRHLNEQPISARPASAFYRMRKFARRNKAVVSGVAIAFAALAIGTAVSLRQAIVAERSRIQEHQLRNEAERQAYRASLLAASSALRYHETADARRHLNAAPEHLRGWEWAHLNSRLDHSLAQLDIKFSPIGMAVSSDGRVVAAYNSGGLIRLWHIDENDVPIRDPVFLGDYHLQGSVHQRRVVRLQIDLHGDDSYVIRADTHAGSVRLALNAKADHQRTPPADESTDDAESTQENASAITLIDRDDYSSWCRSHDGRWAVSRQDHQGVTSVVIREIASGTDVLRSPMESLRHVVVRFALNDSRVGIWLESDDPDEAGLYIYQLEDAASARDERGEAASPPPTTKLLCYRRDLSSLADFDFNSDGTLAVIAGSGSPNLLIVSTRDGSEQTVLSAPSQDSPRVTKVAFSPDDSRIATASADGTVRLWNASDGTLISTMHGQGSSVVGMAFTVDGAALVTASGDETIRWWDATASADPFVLPTPGTVYSLAYSPDGKWLAAACLGGDQPLRIWDMANQRELVAALDGYLSALAFSDDGAKLAIGRSQGPSAIVDVTDGSILLPIEGRHWRTDWVSFAEGRVPICDETQMGSPSSHFLSLGNDGHLAANDAASGQRLRIAKFANNVDAHGCRAALSPDGSVLVVAARNQVHVLDANTWEERAALRAEAGFAYALAFNSDGTRLASGSGGLVKVWDMEGRARVPIRDGPRMGSPPNSDSSELGTPPHLRFIANGVPTLEPIATMSGHSDLIFAVAFSPDGSRIVSGGRDRVIRVWDAERFEEITQLHGHSSLVYSLAFSPDGRTLASGSGDATVRLWDTRTYREMRVPICDSSQMGSPHSVR